MQIRQATAADFDTIWPIFAEIVRAGETYAYPRDCDKAEAQRLWMERPRQTYVAELNSQIVGTYYLKTNQAGPGDHVCNCGYMVASSARGQGVASALCQHSLREARRFGYRAMQFNFVAATNEGAVRLWQKLGFEIVGRLPKAFNHPVKGYVDALVMYQWLGD
ncbi:GNAT family N-acetyltransferase [Motiliproteus sediminis]|uniref:GNAT family N-acetyltransferase n=1 Tax=Motiliproteus sediminis TaxID=1468178 RepID=UPI001AEFC548|nr:N-acetyltransferase [Motiliproteus sediminis]